jgi:hypothetical protein
MRKVKVKINPTGTEKTELYIKELTALVDRLSLDTTGIFYGRVVSHLENLLCIKAHEVAGNFTNSAKLLHLTRVCYRDKLVKAGVPRKESLARKQARAWSLQLKAEEDQLLADEAKLLAQRKALGIQKRL